uniref:Lipoprotein signal peptidase n=1 Tax=uncultured bacterium BAC13K9BAC TaxID=332979 RepID=Q4JN44_9BACT|nr:predicted signal peptidase II [uncultured bacterium BAC13K9BAC]
MQDIRLKGVISICIILTIIVIDYFSKKYALLFDQNYVLNSFITIYKMNNYGIAFSLFNELESVGQLILNIVIFFILAFIAKELFTNLVSSNLYIIGLSLILGGGSANFIDRYDNSAVTDFIILHYKDIYFPAVFNIADLSISIGAILIIIYYMSNKTNEVH